jgi:Zn-dependent metalloprotease
MNLDLISEKGMGFLFNNSPEQGEGRGCHMRVKISERLTLRLLIPFILLALILITSSWATSESDPLIRELIQSTGDNIHISYNSETGKIKFLGTPPGGSIPQPSTISPDATPEVAARNFLERYGRLFGITDHSKELVVKRERTADRGRSFVRFQQAYEGIPVMGGELVVQMDSRKNIISVNGKISPTRTINTTPMIGIENAKEKALSLVSNKYNIAPADLNVSEPELWIYNPVLLGAGPNVNTLVWRMEVYPIEIRPIRELVLVDAQSGDVVLYFNQNPTALYRKIYDHNNVIGKQLPGDPSDLMRNEGQGPSGIVDVDNAYDYAGDTYNFYWNYHGRDSLDNAGMQLISTTRFCNSSDPCPYRNAYWDPTRTQMVYGEGFSSADDVVAHEMTHGVTQYESGLNYINQSGAINESFSDIWGEFVDLTNGRGNDSPSVRWLIGEDLPITVIPNGALRSMSNPPTYGAPDPDRMWSRYFYCGTCDHGGVHINSGVGNKTAYLMTDGGTFNGMTITGLGITKVAKIFYEVQTNLLTSASDYDDLANALHQACSQLVGTSGITASDCQQVDNAISATEMNQPPPINRIQNPGFKSGRVSWVEYSSGSYPIITNDSLYSARCPDDDKWYARLGRYNNAVEYIYQDVTIPSNSIQAYLQFYYNIKTNETWPFAYDTMNVEIRRPSDNALLSTLLSLSNANNTPDSPAWFPSARYDLLSFKGQTIRLRFYAANDYAKPTDFLVDDVMLVTVLAIPNLTPYEPLGWSDKIVVSKTTGTNTDSSPLYTTDTLYVDWALINNGSVATSTTFYTGLYVDGVLRQTWQTNPPLNPNGWSYILDYPIGSLSAGTHTIKIVADSTNAVDESNESDNEYTKTITVQASAISYTVTTNPSGLQVAVDGTTYTSPKSFSWIPGSSHTLSVSSPQSGTSGTRYVYSSWSDGGAQSHTITVPSSSTTFTANFTTQFSLTTSVNPSGGGWVTPSGTNWYSNGQTVSVLASANAGYSFSNWSGDLSGSTNPASLVMTRPKNVTANFSLVNVFSDVPSGYWAYDYIIAIYNNGITTGCVQDDPSTPQNERRYCPEDNVTRGQMAAFIIRAKYGENFTYTQTPYFSDVPSNHTFFKYVQKMKDEGLTAVSGVYMVDEPVTRGQMAAFIIRAKFGENFTYTTTPYFTDVPSTHSFFKYVQKMKDEGITAVTGTYGVDNIVTRAQMAAFLARAFLGME